MVGTEVYIPDEVAISTRLVERLVEEGRIKDRIVIHRALLNHFESKLTSGDDLGINAIKDLKEVCRSKGVEFEFYDHGSQPPNVKQAVRDLALEVNGIIVTSDPIMAKISEAMGIRVLYAAPKGIIQLDKLFENDIMSLHLKEGVSPKVKRGVPGRWYFEEISSIPTSREKLEMIIAELMESVYASYGRESFVEVDKPGTTIVQLKDYRVVITRPPFSDGLEVTVVKPIIKKRLEDYNLPKKLVERLEERAEGILIAGPPGMGKSTFAQALAEHYRNMNKVVKTIESPRDLQLPNDVTQYSKSASKEGELYDVLLLSRPDYTIFDEMRNTEDFNLFIDLRLAGIGMVGIVHATSPIDAIQRVANRVDLGVLPSVIDTVIFMDMGEISTIYTLEMVVKVPVGLRRADLARPTILVKNFLTDKVEYELYVFGERTFFVPIETRKVEAESKLLDKISKLLSRHIPEFNVRLEDGVLKVYIPNSYMRVYIRKYQGKVKKICKSMNIEVDIIPVP